MGPAALEDSDFTARIDLEGLPAGQRIFYRALFQDLTDLRTWSEPATGSFLTPALASRDTSFVWGGDVVGQGWGINPEWGGLRMFETMRRAKPDFFVHSGDTVYADNPLLPEVKLDDGSIWKNLVTPAKSKVAETQDEFRGNFLYNLGDENVRRFNAEVPIVAQWDDHEVRNNWFPTQVLDDPRYQVKSVALLAARAKKSFLEYMPIRLPGTDRERVYRKIAYGPNLEVFVLDMRSYRGPNSANQQVASGEERRSSGARTARLARGRARRFARDLEGDRERHADRPRGEGRADGLRGGGERRRTATGARARNRAPAVGSPQGPSPRTSSGSPPTCTTRPRITSIPGRARFADFDPFWEFVAGPLHAGTFGPPALDNTFGPEVRFRGIPEGMKPNRPPARGFSSTGGSPSTVEASC